MVGYFIWMVNISRKNVELDKLLCTHIPICIQIFNYIHAAVPYTALAEYLGAGGHALVAKLRFPFCRPLNDLCNKTTEIKDTVQSLLQLDFF